MSQCTFKPQISKESNRIISRRESEERSDISGNSASRKKSLSQNRKTNIINSDNPDCTFKPQIIGDRNAIWRKSIQKPRDFEKQFERISKAHEARVEQQKVMSQLGKVTGYSGQPTQFKPFTFEEREKQKQISSRSSKKNKYSSSENAQLYTFDIKLGNKMLKMKVFDYEDKELAVKRFTQDFGIKIEKQAKLIEEIKAFFDNVQREQSRENNSFERQSQDQSQSKQNLLLQDQINNSDEKDKLIKLQRCKFNQQASKNQNTSASNNRSIYLHDEEINEEDLDQSEGSEELD